MIVSSTYTEGPAQVDGRRWVSETHTTDDGTELRYQWLGEQDVALVVQARATTLNQQFAAKAAAQALVVGSLIPLSKLEFRNLFGAAKLAVDSFNAGFATLPALTDAQKNVVRSGLEDFREAQHIERPFRPEVLQLIGLYQSLGILSAEQSAQIVSAGNG